MGLVTQLRWRARQRLDQRSARGEIDEPARHSRAGRHAFEGWVASAEPIEHILFELDGYVYDGVETYERSDIVQQAELPHAAGWRVVIEVPTTRDPRKRLARVVVNGRTAATAVFIFEKPLARFAGAADESSTRPEKRFQAAAAELPAGSRVLELGTRQSVEGASTHNLRWFPKVARADYVMCDVIPGQDVDVVGDLHDLPASWEGRFDAFVAYAVFEHLERPWIAAREVARVLKPGGIAFVATHQCFPLHGYPSDFFRFSREALTLLLEDAGLDVVEAGYEGRAKILASPDLVAPSFHEEWNARWPSYIGVSAFAAKPSAPGGRR